MAESFCEVLLKFVPQIFEFEDLRSGYIANCVFNSLLSYTAIMLNVVTIHAIRKTSSLPKPLKTLLLSLAVSDVGVGLLAQPLYISLLVRLLQRKYPDCIFYKAFFIVISFFSLASFLSVVAISMDRFLAIHLHLRYQELVTHKRVAAVVILIWVFSAFFSLGLFWIPSDILSTISIAGGIICLLLTTIVYWKIYLVLQRLKNQVQALQMQEVQQAAQNGDVANFTRLRRSAVGTFYVYVVLLVCYLPGFILSPLRSIHGLSPVTLKRVTLYTWTLFFLNSSLNPVIYCWKMRHIRHAVMDILRNIVRRKYRNGQQRGAHSVPF